MAFAWYAALEFANAVHGYVAAYVHPVVILVGAAFVSLSGVPLAKVAARGAGHLLVIKVNTDELMDLGERFGIRSIPTMAVFAGGREIARTAGARPAADIEAFVAGAVQAHPSGAARPH